MLVCLMSPPVLLTRDQGRRVCWAMNDARSVEGEPPSSLLMNDGLNTLSRSSGRNRRRFDWLILYETTSSFSSSFRSKTAEMPRYLAACLKFIHWEGGVGVVMASSAE